MERRMFVILVLSGLSHFASSRHPHHYIFVKEERNWSDAREYCRENKYELATVNSEQDLEMLASLNGHEASYAFLGLYRSWGWSRSDGDDYKEGEPGYWNWESGEPTGGGGHYCGSIGETGGWFATKCVESLKFFCYDVSPADPSERFTLVDDGKNWLAAQAYCRERFTDLARVRDDVENTELQKMVMGNQVWIGLTGNTWAWSDGSEPSFTPWRPLGTSGDPGASGAPNGPGDCALLADDSETLGMVEGPCAEKRPFFCDTDPVKKHIVKLKLTSDDPSVDLTDPVVLDAILKWVERKLIDKGITEDLKLSWRKVPKKEKNVP